MDGRRGGSTRARIITVSGDRRTPRQDLLATEEPLEIRLTSNGATTPVTVTMRTPGADFELAVGFLFAEGILSDPRDLFQVQYCVDRTIGQEQRYNIVTVVTRGDLQFDPATLDRNFGISSACGVCGKESLDQVELRGLARLTSTLTVGQEVIVSLPGALRDQQGLFARTGGLHAAALFTADGTLLAIREDVGRHNAVDKVIGWAFLEGKLPLSECILLVSGRASFEIAQKCVAAGIPVMCAVSAPSSLAVDLAERFNLTLIGFLRGDTFNIYHGAARVTPPAALQLTGGSNGSATIDDHYNPVIQPLNKPSNS